MFFAKSQTLLKTASVLPKTTVISQKNQPKTTLKIALIFPSQAPLKTALAVPKATVISQKGKSHLPTINHISQQNHKVLYENIKKIIVNDYKNLIPFVKDIDESKNLGIRKHTEKTGDFIYE